MALRTNSIEIVLLACKLIARIPAYLPPQVCCRQLRYIVYPAAALAADMGMGMNIGIGLLLSFSYILFMTVTSTFAVSGYTSARVAMWIPNILYTIIAIWLYRRAAR